MEQFWNAMEGRASSRSFHPQKPLPQKLEQRLLKLATIQPTSTNGQAFSVIHVKNQETKETIKRLAWNQPMLADASMLLVFCADMNKQAYCAEKNGMPPLQLNSSVEGFMGAIGDAFISAQGLVVAAEMEGLGSCYVGAIRGANAEIKSLLNVPTGAMPLFALVIGYPTRHAGVKPKMYNGIIHTDTYKIEDIKPAVDAYDEVCVDYFTQRGAKDRSDWSSRVAAAYTGYGPRLAGMDAVVKDSFPGLFDKEK